MLDDNERNTAVEIVRNTLPGIYELAELYGQRRWARVARRTRHGVAFRKSAAMGEIPGLREGPKTVQNHRTYIVF